MTDVLLTLVVAAAGGLLARRLRIPGGIVLGSIAAAALLQALASPSLLSPEWRTGALIIIGTTTGSTLNRDLLRLFGRIALPGVVSVTIMLMTGVVVGSLVAGLGVLDPATALFAFAPGGIAEVTAASAAVGADAVLVAATHVLRIIVVLVSLPILLRVTRRVIGNGKTGIDA